MQQDVAFLGDICILIEIRLKYEKKILLSSSRAFSLSTPTFSLSTLRSVTDGWAVWTIAHPGFVRMEGAIGQ